MNTYLCYRRYIKSRKEHQLYVGQLYGGEAITIPATARDVQIVDADQIEDIVVRWEHEGDETVNTEKGS